MRAQTSPSGSGARVPGMPRDATSAPGTDGGRIEGRVLAGDSGRPLRRAQVRLAAADSRLQRVASTDDQGRFSFGSLPAGRYALSASKTGYVPLAYGQRGAQEGGRLITLADNQHRDGADMQLPSGSVITVRVTDRFGEPLAGADVQAQQFGYSDDGLRTLVPVTSAQTARAVTDDRGETRLYGLMPGDYVLSATPPQLLRQLPDDEPGGPEDVPLSGYAPTFYPGTTSAREALTVSVSHGQEAWAQIPMVPTRLARISGAVVDSTGQPSAGSTVLITTAASGSNRFVNGRRQAATDRNGEFLLEGVAPGDHMLVVTTSGGGRRGRGGRGGRASSEAETATVPLTVRGTDIADLYVVTGSGATISGRIRSTGSSPLEGDEPIRPRIRVRQSGGAGSVNGVTTARSATVTADGTFTVERVTGRVLLDVSLPEGWVLLSVTTAGRDITDTPIDLAGLTRLSDVVVTITDAVTQVSGSVHDGRGLPVRDGVVVIQPAGRLDPVAATRRTHAIRLDEQGRFEATGLRPGQYVATAVVAIESGAERSPDVRERLASRGRSFTVGNAEHASLTLEIVAEP